MSHMPGLATHIWKPLLCAAVALLTACAGPQAITSQVSSSGTWPEGRKPGGHYVFERLPSQQTKPELQDKLEAAAQPALAAAGFEPVADPEKADVSVQVGMRVQIDQQRAHYRDPFWGPGPWRPGVGGWWGGGRGGLSMSLTLEPPWVTMTVDLLISDRRSKQALYEAHARYDRQGVVDDRLYPWLFEAALKDFPYQAVSPRAVTVTIPDDNH